MKMRSGPTSTSLITKRPATMSENVNTPWQASLNAMPTKSSVSAPKVSQSQTWTPITPLQGSIFHAGSQVRAWLERHMRFQFHFTPTSASWLNAVEGFLAKLTPQRLKRGAFSGIVDLQAAINRYLAETTVTAARSWLLYSITRAPARSGVRPLTLRRRCRRMRRQSALPART